MIFEYEDEGKVKVDMSSYMKSMLDDFPVKLKKSQMAARPTGKGQYDLGQGRKLCKEDAAFHTKVVKGRLYANEQDPTFSLRLHCYACELKKPNTSDWNKLIRKMKYLKGMQDMKLTLSAKNLQSIKWYVDVSFAVHPDLELRLEEQ